MTNITLIIKLFDLWATLALDIPSIRLTGLLGAAAPALMEAKSSEIKAVKAVKSSYFEAFDKVREIFFIIIIIIIIIIILL